MKRARVILASLAAVAALGAGAAANAASTSVRITPVSGSVFPYRTFILTLPAPTSLTDSSVHVTENGGPVDGLTVVPETETKSGTFGVVLVIDSSLSMHGQPIRAAMDAARAFDSHRALNEKLAIVTFNTTPRVLVPFTSDESQIQSALAAPPTLADGTHIYDAVGAAEKLLGDNKITSGSIVILSDGADTGSSVASSSVIKTATAAHIRVFSVGLDSAAYRPQPLRTLASETGGVYSKVRSPSDLASIYDSLGSQLANQYVLRYLSPAGPKAHVRVRVTVDGVPGVTGVTYVTPGLPTSPAPVFHVPISSRFWTSTAAVVVSVLVAALLVGAGTVLILRPSRRSLRVRMSRFVSMASEQGGSDRPHRTLLTGKWLTGAERPLQRAEWWTRFTDDLEIAGIRMPVIQIVLWTVALTLLLGWVLSAAFGSVILSPLALLVPLVVREVIAVKLRRQRNLFAEQLPDNLQVLASALRAGHSIVGALSVVAEDSAEPSRSEFQRVIADDQLGVPLEQALEVVVRRMANRDLAQVALVASLQRQTGGNTAEVVDSVTETIRERFELRRMVKSLTAQGRMSRWVVSALPVVLLAAIEAINPHYIDPMWHSVGGRIALAVAALMVVAGSLVIRKIVDIEV
jgi:tight adherence protein B